MLKLEKIIEYGLYLLVFLLPIQTRWIIRAGEINGGYSEYGTISLYGTDVLSIILLMAFIIFKITNYKLQITNKCQMSPPKADPPRAENVKWAWLFVGILELAAFVSIFFAPDKLLVGFAYARLLLGIGLFWLITGTNYDRLKLIYSFLAGAVLQAGLGIWQFLTQSSFASKWLGMAAHNAGDLGTSVVETLAGERWLRAYGGLDHPNVLGGVLAISILILVFNRIYRGQFLIFNFKFLKLFTFYFLLSTFFVSLFFTFSRGTWAGVIVGLAVMLMMTVWQKNIAVQKKLLSTILAGAVLVFILFSQYSDLVLTRLSRDTRLEVKSNTERLESYKSGCRIIKNNWLTGVGVGNYTIYDANMRINANPQIANDANMPSWYYQPPHNVFLLVWAEIGIIGLLGFLGLLGYLLISNFKFQISNKFPNSQIPKFPIIFSLSVIILVDHWFWSLHFGVLFFWFMSGLLALPTVREENIIKDTNMRMYTNNTNEYK